MDESMTVEKEEVGGLTIRVVVDTDPEHADPRQNVNLGVMVCGHRNYELGDVQASEGAANDYGTVKNWLVAEHDAIAETIMPLYLFDHSGLSMSVDSREFAVWDSAGWDWGHVGFIFATPETVKETGAPDDTIREQLVNEVSEYDSYLRGDVFGYVIDKDGEVLDSCWGYLAEPSYALSEARASVEYLPEYRREVVAAFAGSEGLGL